MDSEMVDVEPLDAENEEMPARKLVFSPMSVKKERPSALVLGTETKESISVFLRLRPSTTGEARCIESISGVSVAIRPPKDSLFVRSGADQSTSDKYHFSGVFDETRSQKEVYREAAEPLVKSLIAGQNGLLFSYGPTNAGKTYTIQGTPENEGILPRTLRAVLAEVDAQNARAQNEGDCVSYEVWANYLEIYNENIYDLLGAPATAQTGRQALKIKEEAGNIVVKGLKEARIRCLSHAESVLRYGQTNRQVAETMVNQDSSRSHSIFNLRLEKCVRSIVSTGSQVETITSSKLSIVDLAGSERSSRTQNTGIRLKEASNINVSLMNLGRCLEALRWNQQHPSAHPHMVPFRQSKLTRIFQDWFTIRSHMVMLVNVSPDECDFEEMLQALRYGAIAKEIAIATKTNSNNVIRVASAVKKPIAPVAKVTTQSQAANASAAPPTASKPKQFVDEEWTDEMEEMAEQIQMLQTQLYETESRCAQIESTVREEVTEEMMEQMKEIEYSFNARLETERITTEEKFQKKLDIIVREALRRHHVQHQHVEGEGREMSIQLEYYKRRVDELQKEIKSMLSKMAPLPRSSDSVESSTPTETQARVEYLEAEMAALQRQIASSNSQLNMKTKSLSEARSMNEAYERALMQTDGDCKLMAEQNDRLREEIAAAHVKLQHREAELKTLQSTVASTDVNAQLRTELEKVRIARDEALDDRTRLQQQLNEFTLQLSIASSAVKEQDEKLKRERDELAAALSQSRKLAASLEEKNAELTRQIEGKLESQQTEAVEANEDEEMEKDEAEIRTNYTAPNTSDSFVVIGSDHGSKKKGIISRCKALVSRRKEEAENIVPQNPEASSSQEIFKKKKRLYNVNTPNALDPDMAPSIQGGQPIARRLRSNSGA